MKPFGVLVGPERRPAVVVEVVSDVDVAYVLIREKPKDGAPGRLRLASTQATRLEVIERIFGPSTLDAVEVFLGVERYVADQAARDAAKEEEGAK